MHLLYVTMTRRETVAGLVLLALHILVSPLLMSFRAFFCWCCLLFLTAAGYFRNFLTESFHVPHVTLDQILLKAFLGTTASQLTTLLINDLIFFFIPDFYIYTDIGPQFYNLAADPVRIMAQEHYLLTAIAVIILLPIAEELLYRGLIFGTLLSKGLVPALLVSTVLFMLVRVAGLVGMCSVSYFVVSCLQYLPMCLFLAWVYAKSETILTPILAHMVINAVSFSLMR